MFERVVGRVSGVGMSWAFGRALRVLVVVSVAAVLPLVAARDANATTQVGDTLSGPDVTGCPRQQLGSSYSICSGASTIVTPNGHHLEIWARQGSGTGYTYNSQGFNIVESGSIGARLCGRRMRSGLVLSILKKAVSMSANYKNFTNDPAYYVTSGTAPQGTLDPWEYLWFQSDDSGSCTDPGPPPPNDWALTWEETMGGGECGSPKVQSDAADPVNTATGNFWRSFDEMALPGRGPALRLSRTYNSLDAGTSGWFGPGWSSTFDMTVSVSGTTATVKQENGSRSRFIENAGGAYEAPDRSCATLVENPDGTWTFTRRKRTTFTFDTAGLLASIADLNGHAITITRPNSTTVVATNAQSHSLTFTFSGSKVTSVTDSSSPSRTVSYTYDTNGDLTEVVDVAGGHWQFGYDSSHRIVTTRSPRFYGDTTTTPTPIVTNHYDTNGRVDWQTDELGRQTSFDYTSVPGSTKVTDPAGNAVLYTYQHGILVAETRGYGSTAASTWRYQFDPVTTETTRVLDPFGNMSSATYDANGNRLTSRDALGRTTSATYNSLNLPLTTTDGKGITTTYTYDSAGNLLTRSTPWVEAPTTNQVVTYHRDDTAHPDDVTSVTDPAGKTWTFEYDADGNVTEAADPLGNTRLACYDVFGRMTATITADAVADGVTCATSQPAAGTSYFTYNDLGQVLTATDPLGHLTTHTYDDDGNRLTTTDPEGNTSTFVNDAAAQHIGTDRADTSDIATEYWADGRVKTQLNAAGAATTYNYDAQGRLTSTVDPLTRTTTFGYDSVGNQTTIQDPGGNCAATPKTACTTFGYDAVGQLKTITYSDGTTPNVTNIAYDNNGRRTGMTDGSGTWTFAWDSLGRMITSTLANKATVSYGWDLRNQLTSIAYPAATYPNVLGTVTRGYDDAGRWTSTTDWLSNTTSFGYDADGNITTQTNPNGITSTFGYNNAGQVSDIDHAPTTNLTSPFASFDYQRDDNGQITTTASTGVPADSRTWSYDTLNQLTGDTSSTGSYDYDAADNLIQLADGTVQMFDAANQLCWAAPSGTGTCSTPPTGATTYTYDTRGNRTSTITPTGTTTFSYDQARRLKTHTKNSVTTSYGYNADGLRMSKTNGTSTNYAWNLAEGLPTLLKDGSTAFIYGPGNRILEQVNGTTVHYIHTDQLGSARVLTDTTGNVVATRTYDGYGRLTGSTGTATTPFGYAGEYLDTESGHVYLRARYYDPHTAQFLTRDPIEAATREAYNYAGNNPTNFTDPTGLYWGEGIVSTVGEFLTGSGCGDDGLFGAIGDGLGTFRDLLSDNSELVHAAINLGVGYVGGAAAVSFCVGTAGAGCLIFAGMAVSLAVGTVAHHSASLAVGEELSPLKSLRWMAQSAGGGVFGGIARGAWGRGLATGGPLRPEPGSPGLVGLFTEQPFWGNLVKGQFGGWHGGLGW